PLPALELIQARLALDGPAGEARLAAFTGVRTREVRRWLHHLYDRAIAWPGPDGRIVLAPAVARWCPAPLGLGRPFGACTRGLAAEDLRRAGRLLGLPVRGGRDRLTARIRAVLGDPDRLGLLLTGAPGGTLELLDAFAWDGPVRTLDRGRHRRPGTPERWALGPRVVRGTPRSAPPPHLAGAGLPGSAPGSARCSGSPTGSASCSPARPAEPWSCSTPSPGTARCAPWTAGATGGPAPRSGGRSALALSGARPAPLPRPTWPGPVPPGPGPRGRGGDAPRGRARPPQPRAPRPVHPGSAGRRAHRGRSGRGRARDAPRRRAPRRAGERAPRPPGREPGADAAPQCCPGGRGTAARRRDRL